MSLSLAGALALALIVYPGLVFAVAGGAAVGVARLKLAARADGRRGAPLLQPFYDMAKLLAKENVVSGFPLGSVILPAASVLMSLLLLILLPLPGNPLPGQLAAVSGVPFRSDLLTAVLLAEFAGAFIVLAGTGTGSVYARVATMRKVQVVIAASIPWLIAVAAMALYAGRMDIAGVNPTGDFPSLLVKLGAAIVMLLCLPGRLTSVPFGGPESAAQIAGQSDSELGGSRLFLLNLARCIQFVALVSLMFVLLFPTDLGFAVVFPAYILTLGFVAGVLALMETGTGNLKLQQALKFYWYNMAPASVFVALIALYSIVVQ